MYSTALSAPDYLEEKKIGPLFRFLMSHLLVAESPDPIEYLYELLEDCILCRENVQDPPLLFANRHIDSVFRSLDTDGSGTISMDQYKRGMIILGICHYKEPSVPDCSCVEQRIDRRTFFTEAKKHLIEAFKEMVGCPTNVV